MRIGGPFPFNPAGSFPVALGAGGYFYVPPGQYLMSLGPVTALQWWDPIGYSWRGGLSTTDHAFQVSCDGYNYRLANVSGAVTATSGIVAGSGGTNGIGPTATGSTVSFAAGAGLTAKGYVIVGGALPALVVAQPGAQFAVPPLLLIDAPPAGGIQATAIATITAGGALATATLVNVGAGYQTLPNVYVVPQFLDYPGAPAIPGVIPNPPTPVAPNFPPGLIAIGPGGGGAAYIPQNFMQGLQGAFPFSSGALVNFGAGVLAGSGTLTGLVVTEGGSAYAAAPAISFGGTSLGAAAATAVLGAAAATDTSIVQAFINE
jgi:hypothetical protein